MYSDAVNRHQPNIKLVPENISKDYGFHQTNRKPSMMTTKIYEVIKNGSIEYIFDQKLRVNSDEIKLINSQNKEIYNLTELSKIIKSKKTEILKFVSPPINYTYYYAACISLYNLLHNQYMEARILSQQCKRKSIRSVINLVKSYHLHDLKLWM